MMLHRLIDAAAMRFPDESAVRCEGETLTYQALACQANGLARALLDAGIRKTDRVVVFLGKGLRIPVAFYGVFASGGILVPIDPKSPIDQVVRIIINTGAKFLITENARLPVAQQALRTCLDVTHVIGIDPDANITSTCLPWEAALDLATDKPVDGGVSSSDPAFILHTSGSTGVPKLILHTHSSSMSFVEWAAVEYGLSHRDRLSNHSSHHTCFATFDYFAAARVGATTVILPPSALMMPASLAKMVETERISVWYSVPSALVQLVLRGDLEERDLGNVRWVLFAGEAFPKKYLPSLQRAFPNARFSHVYGSTETNVCTFFHLPEGFTGPLPIGRPCGTSTATVVDDELNTVGRGSIGELLIGGPTLMSGYWGDPEINARVLVRRTTSEKTETVMYRTGDRVRWREDGNLEFFGRSDLQVKIRGHRVELGEVESALLSLDRVKEAAAVASQDGEGALAIRAAVVVGAAQSRELETTQIDLRGKLPSHSIPSEIAILEALPRTPTGKIDRVCLIEKLFPAKGSNDE